MKNRRYVFGLAAMVLLFTSAVSSAVPAGATLTPLVKTLSWTGGPFTSVAAEEFVTWDPTLCNSVQCDKYSLTVNIPSSYYVTNPTHSVRVQITWTGGNTDFDLWVFDSSGAVVNSSAQGNTNFELTDIGQLTSGTYQVQVVAFTAVGATYNGTVTLGPPPAEDARLAKYKRGSFTFTQPKALGGPDGLLFGVQDLEPRAAYDALGNIYVAAIEGTPGGTDVWKSQDGGNTFTYLGQPDGAQVGSALAGRAPALGGGDEDIAIGSTGTVYVASLWGAGDFVVTGAAVPLAATMCASTNGGSLWTANPWSQTVPIIDRQWLAAYGDKQVYLTFQQEGALLSGTNSLFVEKSTDGGLTFPQVTQITIPQIGQQPDFQGNIAVDQRNGYVYTVFIGHPGNSVYIARSTDGGLSFILKLVRQGAAGVSYANVFPIIAVDHGGGLHVVYSDGTNVYLCSSSDQGASWTIPLRVNNGMETKTALAPWVDGGDAGKVDILWWATSSASSVASDATWKVYFAQVQNAFAKNPTVTENAATGVFHTGPICVNGTACAAGTRSLAEYASTTIYRDGNAMIVYPDNQQTTNPMTYFIKQTGGSGILSGSAAVQPRVNSEEEMTTPVPDHYSLGQNFPNPFNPATMISYQLPLESNVQLRVYNTLGQEVELLVNERQPAGTHAVSFDASRLSSGIYFYKLVAGNFIDTKRFVLLK